MTDRPLNAENLRTLARILRGEAVSAISTRTLVRRGYVVRETALTPRIRREWGREVARLHYYRVTPAGRTPPGLEWCDQAQEWCVVRDPEVLDVFAVLDQIQEGE